jgi:hypothetical protein
MIKQIKKGIFSVSEKLFLTLEPLPAGRQARTLESWNPRISFNNELGEEPGL